MFRFIMSIILTLVLIGLAVAVLRWFNWDIGAVFSWIWNLLVTIVNNIADFFVHNSFFQNLLS